MQLGIPAIGDTHHHNLQRVIVYTPKTIRRWNTPKDYIEPGTRNKQENFESTLLNTVLEQAAK